MSVNAPFQPLVHKLTGACVALVPVGLHDVFVLFEA